MSKRRPSLDVARRCAKSDATYDKDRGGYVCNGCGRHFQLSRINGHVYAARRRVSEADAVVRP